jgi:putative transposase
VDCATPLVFRLARLFDHDAKFGSNVFKLLRASGIRRLPIGLRSPWHGVAEPWIGSVRREVFDHVILLNGSHLRRLGLEYLAYYHEDRTRIRPRLPRELRPTETSRIKSRPRIGGLHHRYSWVKAA